MRVAFVADSLVALGGERHVEALTALRAVSATAKVPATGVSF